MQHASGPGNAGRRHARWPSLRGRHHGSACAVHPVRSGVAHLRGTTNGDADLRSGGALTTLAEQLAGRICSLSFETLPADVVEHAKRCVLDQLGIQILGETLPASQAAIALARSAGAAPAVSRVPGLGDTVSAPYAALAGAAFGHSCEFDDCHFLCGHPGACVIPPALALSQQEGLGGREFLTAVVAGYEAMVLAVGPIHHSFAMTGWQGSKIGGVFGAAAASAVLLGLGETRTAHALAIAGSEASGTLEYDRTGGDVKRLFPAMAARSGVEAALLARSGLTGPLTILEGERGMQDGLRSGRGSGCTGWTWTSSRARSLSESSETMSRRSSAVCRKPHVLMERGMGNAPLAAAHP